MSTNIMNNLAHLNKNSSLSSELEQFFTKKKLYRDFMLGYKADKKNSFETNIDGHNVNTPLSFYIVNNRCMIVGSDFEGNTLFTKNISEQAVVDSLLELNELKEQIIHSEESAIIIKIEDLFNKSNAIKNIPEKSDEYSEISAQIRHLYQNGGKKFQKLLEKHQYLSYQIYNKHLDLINKFTSSLLETNKISDNINNYNEIESLAQLAPYLIYRSLIKTNNYITKNSLFIEKENIANIVPENLLLVRDIFSKDHEFGDEDEINLLTFNGSIRTRQYKDLVYIQDLSKLGFIDVNKLTSIEEIDRVKFKDGNRMFENYNLINNNLDKDYLLAKDAKAKYLFRYQPVKLAEKPKKGTEILLVGKAENINLYPDIELDINLKNRLLFYSNSRNSRAGSGTREQMDEPDEIIDNLNKIDNWRKKLSNFHIFKSQTGHILPIVIDGNKFASVEHFFHYCKFNNTDLDLSPEEKKRYQNYADKFKLEGEFGTLSGNSIKIKGGKKSGYMLPNNWGSKQSNRFKYRDTILLKGLLAKMNQFPEIKDILLNTSNALIVHPLNGNVRRGTNEYATVHMYLRSKLSESEILLDNYDKQSINEDVQSSNDLKSKLEEIDLEAQRAAQIELEKQDIGVGLEVPLDDSPSSESSIGSVTPESEEDLSIAEKQLKFAKELLAKRDINLSQFKDNNAIVLEATLLKSLEDNNYTIDFDSLEEYKTLQGIDGIINHIPPDGNCLFYSIIEGMRKQNIYTMNYNDGEEEGQYPRDIESLLLISGNSVKRGDIHTTAAQKLREDVANKINATFTDASLIENNTNVADGITSILSDYSTVEDYVAELKKNARTDNGLWGGDLEIKTISAMFNLNITVLASSGYTTLYMADKSKEYIPNGPEYNTTKNNHIYLGFLEKSKHYVLIDSSKAVLEDLSSNEPLKGYKYFTHNVSNPIIDGGKLEVNCAIVFNDNEDLGATVLGLYDSESGIIKHKPDSEDEQVTKVFNEIIKELNDFVESDEFSDDMLIDINYFRDITNGHIYWRNKDGNDIKVGQFEGIHIDEDGETITDKMIAFNV